MVKNLKCSQQSPPHDPGRKSLVSGPMQDKEPTEGCSDLTHCPGRVPHISAWSFPFPGPQSALGSTRKLQWEHPPMTRRSTQVLCLFLRHQCVLGVPMASELFAWNSKIHAKQQRGCSPLVCRSCLQALTATSGLRILASFLTPDVWSS